MDFLKIFLGEDKMMLKAKQKGFTLLELLVVITLLAILSVGALVAYEGIGKNAQNVGAANNITVADSAVRNFAALESVYPNQWDNLVNVDDGSVNDFIADETRSFITSLDLAAVNTASSATGAKIAAAMKKAGITEFQSLLSTSAFPEGAIPNEQWNESAPGVTNPADEMEIDYTAATAASPAVATIPANSDISVFANGGSGTCTVGGVSMATPKAGAALTNSAALNRINDVLDSDVCHLVLAVGFGKDVPGSTLNSKVAISTAPTYVSDNINPAEDYARYVALFHVGSGDTSATATPATQATVTEFRKKAKLIGIVDTEGRAIDQAIAGAFEEENE